MTFGDYLVGIVGSYSSAEIPKAFSMLWGSVGALTRSMIMESVGSFMFRVSHLKYRTMLIGISPVSVTTFVGGVNLPFNNAIR